MIKVGSKSEHNLRKVQTRLGKFSEYANALSFL